jgi:adenylosuccinate synthase
MGGTVGELVQKRGGEVGATTGRPRDCGWPDFVAAKYSAMINGVKSVALTKPDVLDGVGPVKICKCYKIGEIFQTQFSANADIIKKCKPEFFEINGWDKSENITSYDDLPEGLKNYIDLIDTNIAPVSIVSTGADRRNTIIRHPELVK